MFDHDPSTEEWQNAVMKTYEYEEVIKKAAKEWVKKHFPATPGGAKLWVGPLDTYAVTRHKREYRSGQLEGTNAKIDWSYLDVIRIEYPHYIVEDSAKEVKVAIPIADIPDIKLPPFSL